MPWWASSGPRAWRLGHVSRRSAGRARGLLLTVAGEPLQLIDAPPQEARGETAGGRAHVELELEVAPAAGTFPQEHCSLLHDETRMSRSVQALSRFRVQLEISRPYTPALREDAHRAQLRNILPRLSSHCSRYLRHPALPEATAVLA